MNTKVLISAALFLSVWIFLAGHCECKRKDQGKWEIVVKDKKGEAVGKCTGYMSPQKVKKCCCSKKNTDACTLDYAVESAPQGMKPVLKEHGPGGKWKKC